MVAAGLVIALECNPPEVEVHLYGYNWHSSMWQFHRVSSLTDICISCWELTMLMMSGHAGMQLDREEQFARKKAREGLITIHETECKVSHPKLHTLDDCTDGPDL